MSKVALEILLLALLGDESYCYLVIDWVEWTHPRYHHQN